MQGKTYPSQVNFGMFVFMSLISIGPILPAIFIAKNSYLMYIAILFGVSILLIHIAMFRKTYYQLDNEKLFIRSGLFYKKEIPITTIRKIEETKNVFQAPALDHKRLAITYNSYDTVYVSPKDKASFIEDLMTLNPAIEKR